MSAFNLNAESKLEKEFSLPVYREASLDALENNFFDIHLTPEWEIKGEGHNNLLFILSCQNDHLVYVDQNSPENYNIFLYHIDQHKKNTLFLPYDRDTYRLFNVQLFGNEIVYSLMKKSSSIRNSNIEVSGTPYSYQIRSLNLDLALDKTSKSKLLMEGIVYDLFSMPTIEQNKNHLAISYKTVDTINKKASLGLNIYDPTLKLITFHNWVSSQLEPEAENWSSKYRHFSDERYINLTLHFPNGKPKFTQYTYDCRNDEITKFELPTKLEIYAVFPLEDSQTIYARINHRNINQLDYFVADSRAKFIQSLDFLKKQYLKQIQKITDSRYFIIYENQYQKQHFAFLNLDLKTPKNSYRKNLSKDMDQLYLEETLSNTQIRVDHKLHVIGVNIQTGNIESYEIPFQ